MIQTKATGDEGAEKSGMVRCGDCKCFVRDGKCNWYTTPEGKRKDHAFGHAPFWVWSDCYSDKEQVRKNVTSKCPCFVDRSDDAKPQVSA